VIDWVFEVAKYSYGEALPGMIAPSLILTLHKDQCQHWAAFANAHVNRIKDFCFMFCHLLLEHICSEDVVKQLWKRRVCPELNKRVEAASSMLEDLIRDESRSISSHSPTFQALVQRICGKITAGQFTDVLRNLPKPNSYVGYEEHLGARLTEAFNNRNPVDMNKLAAKEALHFEMAYYEVRNM